MEDAKARLILKTASDEDAILTKPTQTELSKMHGAVRDAGIPVSARHMTFDSISGGGGLTGEFIIPLIQFGSPVVAGVIVAWLQGRAGRKAKIKIGDVEAEARTPKEVDALLQAAKRYQDTVKISGGSEDEP